MSEVTGAGLPDRLERTLAGLGEDFPHVAIIATDGDGRVRYWSRQASRLYGWRAEEALGRDILDLTPARQSQAEAAAAMRTLAAGDGWQGEMVLKGRDGRPFRAYVVNVPIATADGPLIVGASVLIDDCEALEQARAELEARLEAVAGPGIEGAADRAGTAARR